MISTYATYNWVYLIISFVGLFILGAAFLGCLKANACQSWDSVPGKVVESDVVKTETHNFDGGNSIAYNAHIRYAYSVMAQEYTGDRIAFGVKAISKAGANNIAAKYPLNAQVTVYYDPKKPQDAVLETRTKTTWLQILIGAVLSIVGVYLAIR